MATIQQKIALVGADDVKKAIADIVSSGQTGFDALQKAINSVEAKQFDAQINTAKSGIGDLFKTLVNLRSIVAGSIFGGLALALFNLARGADSAALSIERSSKAAGISRGLYQSLAQAVKDAGGSQDQLDTSLRRFSQRVSSEGTDQLKAYTGALKLFIDQTGGQSAVVLKTVDDLEKIRAVANQLAPGFKAAFQQIGDVRGLSSVEQIAFQLEHILQKTPNQVEDVAQEMRKFLRSVGVDLPTHNVFENLETVVEKSKGTLASMGISLVDFNTGLKKTNEQALIEFIDNVSKIPDAATRAQRIIQVFGKSAGKELVDAISGGVANLSRIRAELEKRGIFVSDEALAHALQQEAQINQLSDAWNGFVTSLGRAIGPILTPILQFITFILDSFRNVITSFGALFGALKLAFDDAAKTAQSAWDKIANGARALIDTIRALVAPIANLFNFSGGTPTPLGVDGHATGGLIRGRPGIDTNLAWLTDGEYVIRRSMVDKLGVGFLDALNAGRLSLEGLRGFSLGGLVENMTAPFAIPAFAGGGLNVSPTAPKSSNSVTVVLDGRKFAMTASESVATSLLRYARKHNYASAGRSPSRVR